MMNGHLILDTPIAVDFWNIRKCSSANVFFLSHIHSDHTVGLTSSWSLPIYCSKVTGDLLCHKVSLPDDLIRPLELLSPTLIPLNPSHSEMVTVTAIDANHCPGSVMFLFQGYFGTILYTGDFRYTSKMFVDSPLDNISVDMLYLDNTYCDPLCVFGAREDEKEKLFEIIKSYPEHDVLLGMHSIGKPDLLIEIAKEFQEYIGVPPSMYEYLEILEVPNVFQVDTLEHECRLRVVPAYYISGKLFSKLTRPTIAILTTALYVGLESTPFSNQSSVHIVPYSDHSSYVELQQFVKRVQPARIIPIVGRGAKGPFNVSFAKRADMSCFDNFLSRRPQEAFTIPAGLDVREARSVRQSNDVLSTSKRRKRSLVAMVKKSLTSKGVVFECSPQKGKNKPSVRENVVQSPDNPSDLSGSHVTGAADPDALDPELKKTCTLEKISRICVEKSCPPEKSTHILNSNNNLGPRANVPNSNNDLESRANTPNLNQDSHCGVNSLNKSQRADLEILNDGTSENNPVLLFLHTGSESQRDPHPKEKTPGNPPSLTRVQESAKNSHVDENSEKDTSSSTSSELSIVYNIEPLCRIVNLNHDGSIQPQIPTRKRKLPPMFNKEFHSVNKRRCIDYWNSETSTRGGSVCDGEQAQNGESELEDENGVATDILSVTSRDSSPRCRPASSFLSKTSRPQKSIFISSISDYLGRFDVPGWTFTSCQKVFSDFAKKQRSRYAEKS